MNPSYDDYADSDEDQHDAYLERMKEEGKIREENANDSSDESGEETGELTFVLGPGLLVWVRGGTSTAVEVDAICVLSQMSPSILLKRKKTWQRSEF